jgi:uncharacterized protein (TIGR03437 family)
MTTINASSTAVLRRIAILAILIGLSFIASISPVSWTGMAGLVAAQQSQVVLVNAASYANDAGAGVAPDSIAALYGQFITQGNQAFPLPAGATSLPTTLGGVSVTIGGKPASLFFAGTTQINLAVPADLPDGNAPIVVTNSDGSTRSGTVSVVRVQPGVFTALSTGTGTAAALTTKDGTAYNFVANPDGTARDLDAGSAQQPNYLVLFGTGLRLAGQANVKVTVQGVPAQVIYAGKVGQFVGLDQLNVIIPPELSGYGNVQVRVSAGNKAANTVSIKLGGEIPSIRLTNITEGQVVQGELAAQDQVQPGPDNNTYFFDAYGFQTTVANTSVAIDVRGTAPLNAMIILYRNDNGTLRQVGQDDDTGGYGAPQIANNFNPLLLTVIQTPGQYVLFITSADGQPNGTGRYSLKYVTNVIQQVSYGQNLNGQIATSDYKNSSNTYVDLYWFNGIQGERPAIGMNSTALDSYLILQGNAGDPPLTWNDNAAGSTTFNSLINNYSLTKSDIFIIIATPFEPEKTGAYTLTLNRQTTMMNQLDLPGLNLREALPFSGRGGEQLMGRRESIPRPVVTRSVVSEP